MKIIYSRSDGGVSVITLANQADAALTAPFVSSMTPQEFIDWVIAKDVPADATNVSVVQDEDVPEQPAAIPSVLSIRQGRRALYQSGYLSQVDALIASIPGTDGDKARIDWNYATEVRRDHPLVASMAAALPLTEQQLDELFTLGATL
jgi:hypothetical protein